MQLLEVDEKVSLRGETLQQQINEDRKNGKTPFYVIIFIILKWYAELFLVFRIEIIYFSIKL